MHTPRKVPGFSLTEVVLALGITSFCLVALMGLFAVGIRTEKESADILQVSHLSQKLLAMRRNTPDSNLGAKFPIPALQPGSSIAKTVVNLDQNGLIAPSPAEARYALTYRVDAPAVGSRKNFSVYLNFHWPAQASPANAAGHYEVLASIPPR